ncbi:MAG: hypothetical protein KTV68_16760 [Acidimicrobiia bacterium]|nr:hypothetical protein [Acidimicrobiia bacterium]MCY4434707.1 hypothetical protein [bacterium]
MSLILMVAMLNGCDASDFGNSRSSSAKEIFDTLSGVGVLSAISYDSLTDQVLDSDAVVIGHFVDVSFGGAIYFDDDSGTSIEHIVATLRVEDVIYASQFVSVVVGSDLQIVLPKAPTNSIQSIQSKLVNNVPGVHSLFEVVNDGRRSNTDYFRQFEGTWIYQAPSLTVIKSEDGSAVTGSHLIFERLGSEPEYTDVVAEFKEEAEMIARNEWGQPDDVIGLQPSSADVSVP